MKKKLYLTIGALLVLGLIITSIFWFTRVPDFSTLSPAEITIIALPTPPDIFTVIKTQDIEKIMALFNAVSYKKTIMPADKGWEISLSYPGTEIQLLGQYITVNGKSFHASSDITIQLRQLLDSLGYLNH